MQPDTVYRLLSVPVQRMLRASGLKLEGLQEIRLRTGKPVLLQYCGQEFALCEKGLLSGQASEGYRLSAEELKETLEYVSGYSLYAFDEEMRQGFLTVPGGHRVGLAGHIVQEDGHIRCIRYISFLNIRLSHQRKGCADFVMPFLYREEEICHTLVISPPGGGKTTLLRDMIRQISDGCCAHAGRTVGVVDERSELGGSYHGVPEHDLGMRTDVLDCCPKAEGMLMLLRSMAPQVIAVDELGGSRDGEAVEQVFHCGCRLLATVHGASIEELERKPALQHMIQARMFERYIVLAGRQRLGCVQEIRNARQELMYRANGGKL